MRSSMFGGTVVVSVRHVRIWIIALGAAGALLLAPAAASAWSPQPCSGLGAFSGSIMFSSTQCIGHRKITARGHLNASCVLYAPTPGQIYPSPNACGGGGAEYIAQARMVAKMGGAAAGVDSSTQWEGQVQLANGRGGSLRHQL